MEAEGNVPEDHVQTAVKNQEEAVPGRPSPKKRNTKNSNNSQIPQEATYNTVQPDQLSSNTKKLEKNASVVSGISQNSPSSMNVPGGGNNNPFKFIEMALTEAKMKIDKMKATPKILESLPDVSYLQ